MEQVQAAAAMEVAALQEQVEQVQAAAATELEVEHELWPYEDFFADAVGWLLDRVDGGQLEAEEQARWEDIRSELAGWHEVDSEDSEEEEEEGESLPSLPSIPEAEAEPEEEVRCSSVTCPSLRYEPATLTLWGYPWSTHGLV